MLSWNTKLKRKYPFEKMEIGDSFLAPIDRSYKNKMRCYLRLKQIQEMLCERAGRIRKYKKLEFTTRMKDDLSGVRCWRVK